MTEGYGNIGRTIGNYRVLTEIGSGGFGRVYQAEHVFLTERIVAIKFLHTHLSSPEERERFLQEAHFLEKLKHTYILHIFDLGIDDGFPYLVTEYAPNGSLRNRIKRSAPNPLPTEEVISILSQIGQALYHAHQQQIIHRDLKPENILFNANGEALLTDYGISTSLSTNSVKAVTLIGTPPYMAPEQFQGIVSKESDQYALGCIAYELVTGKALFTAPDFFSMGFKHMSANPVPPRQLNPTLPMYVEQAILKALAKQRSDRHPDIRAFISALCTPNSFSLEMPTVQQAFLPPQSTVPFFTENPTLAQKEGSRALAQQDKTQSFAVSDKDKRQAAPNPRLQTLHEQGPVTPLPSVMQTPLAGQGPLTPFLPVWQTPGPITPLPPIEGTIPIVGDEYPTMISSPGIHENTKENEPQSFTSNMRVNNGKQPAAGFGIIAAPPIRTNTQKKVGSKRTLFIFATICILLIASIIGVLVFALPSSLSHSGIAQATKPASAATTIPIQTTGKPTQQSIHGSGPNFKTTPGATATHGTGPQPTPISTLDPTPISTSDPTVGPTPDPTADPTPVAESLTVPFISTGVKTVNSYSGTVTIFVSGTGQAGSTKNSDAFYYYTDASGNPITPVHPECWVLNINGQSTDNFVSLPPYDPGHSYTFQISVPGGPLTFDVCDPDHADNTGQYYITVTQN